MDAPNIRASKYLTQTLTDLKGKIDSNAMIVEDFSMPLSIVDCPDRKSIGKHQT